MSGTVNIGPPMPTMPLTADTDTPLSYAAWSGFAAALSTAIIHRSRDE